MSEKPRWGRFAAVFRAARTPAGRARSGCAAVEGLRVCERALRAGARFEAALLAASFDAEEPRRRALIAGLAELGVVPETVPDALLDELGEGRDLGGIVALVRMPEPARLRDVLPDPESSPGSIARFALCVCDVEEPGNVGALARTALASGAALLVATGRSEAFHPKAVRTSMGSVFRLAIARERDPLALVEAFRALGVRTVAAVASGGIPLVLAPESDDELGSDGGPFALLIGSEAFGLGPELAAACDQRVSIPMPSAIDSYSVNAAAAILCFALARRGT